MMKDFTINRNNNKKNKTLTALTTKLNKSKLKQIETKLK